MANKVIQFLDDSGDLVPVLAVDNGDDTYSLSVDAALEVGALTIGKVDQGDAGAQDWKVTLDSETVVTKGLEFSTSTVISGQITVTTAGTAVQGTAIALSNGVYIKALLNNSGAVYVGNDGSADVTATNGFQLSSGEIILIQVANLNQLWFDSAVNGDKVCWIKA